jgi:hypothetical protein
MHVIQHRRAACLANHWFVQADAVPSKRITRYARSIADTVRS